MINTDMFKFHKLNKDGIEKAVSIQTAYTNLYNELETLGVFNGREGSLAATHLETACFFSKKAIAIKFDNQDHT